VPFTGIGVLKLGHIAFHVDDPKAISEFYAKVLGFKVSDWIDDFFVFMRCNADHHTVNFITGPHGAMHHCAFELRDFSHLQNACDLFGQKDIKIVWGPVRLGPGHNVAAFTRNPDDHVIEVYAELDQMKDEALGYWDPRPWHKDHPQYPKVWPRGEGSLYVWGPPPTPDFRRADASAQVKK
jgi:catechol 2,3-dioxygenase-like lactoylglutathione lyase family enzyme